MKPKKIPPIGANTLNVLEWLDSILPDTPENQAIADEEEIKYNLAVALTQAREASGHTQTSLANKLDVRQSLVSKWEKIDHNHTLETLLQLCQVTGAKLVMGLEINGELVSITPAAQRCILLSETAFNQLEQQATTIGLSAREVLLAPILRKINTTPKHEVAN
jgi:transcriptional regulator with XRE-family HTH domain